MTDSFRDVSFLVTGGARGIGRRLVTTFVGYGAKVTFVDMDEAAAEETVELAGAPERVRFLRADVSDPDGAQSAVEALDQVTGQPWA